MNTVKLNNHALGKPQITGRKVKLSVSTISPEERLNTIVDIIIERMLEERNKKVDV